MGNYDEFAEYYDKVMWKPEALASWIKRTAKESNPEAKSILELATGTGNLLLYFKDEYEIVGLDLSEGMLKKAKEKIPEGKFINADMTNFSLDRKFDIIACIFDSINHIDGLSNWGKVFELAAEHLTEKGIFVFDFNTESKLEEIAQKEPHSEEFDDKVMVMEVRKENGAYPFYCKIFKDGKAVMEDIVSEYAYSNEAVIKEAKKYFVDVETFNSDMTSEPTADSRRIYVACRKS